MNSKWCFIGVLLLLACKEDSPEPIQEVNNLQGVYVANEGNFTQSNGSVSYINPETGDVQQELFEKANGRPLGDVIQSMMLFDSKLYVVVNNSQKIEVVDPNTFKSTGSIGGLTSPRYILPIDGSKAYVTDLYANVIHIVDLQNLTKTGSIDLSGWSEALLNVEGKIYVTNRKHRSLYIIDPVTDVIEDSISVGVDANSMVLDQDGQVWVLCSGGIQEELPRLHKINPQSREVVETFLFSDIQNDPIHLKTNTAGDQLLYINKAIYQMSINATELPAAPLVAPETRNFYGLAVHPVSGELYVADATVGFSQKGFVYRYRPDGSFVDSYRVGFLPQFFLFF